jgi:hypothetical protein
MPRAATPVHRSRLRWLLPVLAVLATLAAPASSAAAAPSVAPSAEPAATAGCGVDAKLVPACNVLWGAAAGGFSDTPRDVALREWEAKTGRTAQVYHTYHKGDELFPTAAERAMAREVGRQRVLMLNWKVAYGSSWAAVARGEQDARIDRLAAHVKATFPEKFFLVLHHEPENDVNTDPARGMTAGDYAAMYRHTVLRLKARGVSNAVFVMAYMNYEKWNNQSWWWQLYPGDDVVDWVGVDSYVAAAPGTFHHGDFRYLMDRTTDTAKFPGWYTWATTHHPGKPVMVAEWGVHECATACDPAHKARVFDTVLPQLATMPAVKGLLYFDTARDQHGHDIRVDSSPQALAAFKRIAADPRFTVNLRAAATTPVQPVSPVVGRPSVDGDARAELVHVDTAGRVRAFRNVGGLSGVTFPETAVVVGTGWDPARTRFADLDADGKTEIIHIDPAGVVRAFRNVGGLTATTYPQAGIVIGTGWDPARTRFADLDADGRADIIHIDAWGVVRAFRNIGALTSTTYPQAGIVIGTGWDPTRTFLTDLDADTRAEIIHIDPTGVIRAYRNIGGLVGTTYPQPGIVIGTGWDPTRTRFADLDADGKTDIIHIDPTGTLRAYRNTGALTATTYPQPATTIGTGWDPTRTLTG